MKVFYSLFLFLYFKIDRGGRDCGFGIFNANEFMKQVRTPVRDFVVLNLYSLKIVYIGDS